MRLVTSAAVAATTMLGASAAAVLAGRYGSNAALRRDGRHGGAPPGFDEAGVTLHDVGGEHVTLTRTLGAGLPGRYGLIAPGTHAQVGEPLGTGTSPDALVRRLLSQGEGTLSPGSKAWMTPQLYSGTPGSALGIAYTQVEVPGELGILPGWFVPGDRQTWVITVHGLGTTLEHPLNLLPMLRKLRLPVLNIAYRGDREAPPQPDGIGHLGATEWHDLDAAMRFAIRYGARRLVLYGWSTGASMALYAAAHSALRQHVSGLVLDSPVLDWRATVRSLAARRLPGFLVPLAVRAAEGRTRLGPARLGELHEPGVPRTYHRPPAPVLLFHSKNDEVAPLAGAQAFAQEWPEMVNLRMLPDGAHAAGWNADPAAYEEALRRFLIPLM